MPLLWLSLAFLSGIVFADALALTSKHWLAIGAIGLLFIVFSRLLAKHRPILWSPPAQIESLAQALYYPRSMSLAVCLIALALGGFRYQSEQEKLQQYSTNVFRLVGREVILRGVIADFPDERDTYTAIVMAVESLSLVETPIAEQNSQVPLPVGRVLVRASPFEHWHYGDRIQVVGRMELPAQSEGFSYRAYLKRKGIFAYLPRAEVTTIAYQPDNPFNHAIYTMRQRCLSALKKSFPEPQASLLAGILLGIESGIPAKVRQAFVTSGTMHIVAISGFNITLLTGLFMAILGRALGRWRGVGLTTLLVGIYAIFVGASASVVRAAIMGVLTLFAAQIGRRQSGINSLVFVAGLMALFGPDILWDISFQLSFAATLGLVLYAPSLNEWTVRQLRRLGSGETAQRWGNMLSEWALFTLAAQLTTLPILLYHFQELSLIALLINPLILPVQPVVMVGGGIAMLLALVIPPLGQISAYLVVPLVTYTIRMVEWSAALPYSALRVSAIPFTAVLLFYLILFALTRFWQRVRLLSATVQPLAVVGFLSLLITLVWQTALAAPDGRLHLILLDVSRPSQSSEALLIRTPQGRFVLLNGGDSPSRLLEALDRWLPLTYRRLDWVVLGGARQSQIAAVVELIERERVAQLWWAIPQGESAATVAIQRAAKEGDVPIHIADVGQSLELGEAAKLTVSALGERGAVFVLEWEQFRAWLPLGMDAEMRKRLLESGQLIPSSVYLLANNGSGSHNPLEFVRRLQPQLILLSVSKGDWYGLPHAETIARLEGYPLLRTDLNGWIHIQTDGKHVWVEVERNTVQP